MFFITLYIALAIDRHYHSINRPIKSHWTISRETLERAIDRATAALDCRSNELREESICQLAPEKR